MRTAALGPVGGDDPLQLVGVVDHDPVEDHSPAERQRRVVVVRPAEEHQTDRVGQILRSITKPKRQKSEVKSQLG